MDVEGPVTDCLHSLMPLFSPRIIGKFGWQSLPFVYERIRIQDYQRAEKFLSIFELERCKMIEMSCDTHDKYAADSQFITHLTGRILGQQGLQSTPIDTRGKQRVMNLCLTIRCGVVSWLTNDTLLNSCRLSKRLEVSREHL